MNIFTWNLIAPHDLRLGDDLQLSLTWKSDGGVPGAPVVPVDLTGWAGVVQFFRTPTDGTPFQTQALTLGGVTGGVPVFVPAATVRSWFTRGVYFYAVVLTGPSGFARTLVRGLLEIS